MVKWYDNLELALKYSYKTSGREELKQKQQKVDN